VSDGDSPPEPKGIGAGRIKTLRNLKDTDRLKPVDNPQNVEDLITAIEEMTVPRYFSPPEKEVRAIRKVYNDLPDDAQEEYIRDEVLLRRINAARRQFNTLVQRATREKEMPSPVEAGFSKYPAKKAKRRARSTRNASEELKEKLERVRAGAKGGKQRALKATGSSVAEHNEQQRENRRERMRARLEQGDIVVFRNPDLQVGEVVRVNRKSVRLTYPHPFAGSEKHVGEGTYPEMAKDTIQLDSGYLKRLDVETLEDGRRKVGLDSENDE